MSAGIEAVLPLTAAQRGIYLEASSDPETYLGQVIVEVRGPLESSLLAQAWLEVQEHHAGLRSHIGTYGETQVLVVRAGVRSEVGHFELGSVEPSLARTEAIRICDDERRLGIDIAHGPLARLTLIVVESGCTWLCLTHHHIGLDGASVRTVFEDLAARCAAAPLKPTAALEELLRAWPALTGAGIEVRPGEPLSTFSIAHRTRSLFVHACATGSRELREAARRSGTSPAVLAVAAWMCALRTVRDTDLTVAVLSVDRRPAQIAGGSRTVGMLTDTVIASERVPSTASPVVVAERILQRLTPPVLLPPLAPALERARRDGATGGPDTLLTVYSGELLGAPPAGASWSLVRASEPTEFAVDATIVFTEGEVRCELQLDALRVDERTAGRLVENLLHFLKNPSACLVGRSAAGPARSHITTARTTPGLEAAVQGAVESVVGFDPGPDTDLYAAGVDSLSLLAIAVALRGLGHPLGVGALLESGTIRRVARYLSQESTVPDLSVRIQSEPSPLEAGYLRLSSLPVLGSAPMHEQSVLTFAGQLDPARLDEAFCSCLESLPSLGRLWDGPESLTRPASSAPAFDVVHQQRVHAQGGLVLDVLDADLGDTFAPDGRGLLRLVQVPSDKATTLVLSFHHAILDGWSFATFVRSLQRRYEASDCVIDALDTDLYRRWALSREQDQAGLAAYLNGLAAAPDPSERVGERVSGKSLSHLPREMVADRVGSEAASETSVLVGVLALAIREVLGWDEAHPLGLRATVRDGSAEADQRTVGQLTVDMPLRMHGDSFGDAATAARETYVAVHRHGHLGQTVISHALADDRSKVLSLDTALVLENYFARDELALRTIDRSAWSELSSWRRDVSGTPRTITVGRSAEGWFVDITSTIDRSPQELATAIIGSAMSVLGRDGR